MSESAHQETPEFDPYSVDRHPPLLRPVIRVKRRAGRVKRWVKRKLYERTIGREYQAFITVTTDLTVNPPGSVDNAVAVAVIVPVFNPPVDYLRQCLTSVVQQTAVNWQLVVSDDGSSDPAVLAYLQEFEAEHRDNPRITVVHQPNGGISSAMNAGLAAVTCEYFGWLDHDDALNPTCMAEVSAALAADTTIDLLYTDEDKISPRGEHYELNCKPDFSPELLLSQMYLCHFTVFRTELVRNVQGFRSTMDGAQDYDLVLRILPNVRGVHHIPRPLYHWRAWSGSTALSIEAKPWAQDVTARVQREHLQRTFGGGEVMPSPTQGLNDVHPTVENTHRVSVIIPTIGTPDPRTGRPLVEAAIASLRAREHLQTLQVVVVTTGELPPIPGADRQVVYRTDSFNFAEAINLGRQHADGDYLLLLNDDTSAACDNPVTRMMELGQIDGVAAVGAKLTYPDGRLQHVGMVLLPSGPTHCWIAKPGKYPGYFGSTLTARNYSAVTAAAMLVRADAFDAVDGFDTKFARDFNDVDFCLRLRQLGWRIAWTPYAHFVHHEGATMARKRSDSGEAQLFNQRWAELVTGSTDPYYSPALHADLRRIYEPR